MRSMGWRDAASLQPQLPAPPQHTPCRNREHFPPRCLSGVFNLFPSPPPNENQSDATLTKGGEQPHTAEQQLKWDLCGVHGSLGGNLYPRQMSPQAQSQALGQENM